MRDKEKVTMVGARPVPGGLPRQRFNIELTPEQELDEEVTSLVRWIDEVFTREAEGAPRRRGSKPKARFSKTNR